MLKNKLKTLSLTYRLILKWHSSFQISFSLFKKKIHTIKPCEEKGTFLTFKVCTYNTHVPWAWRLCQFIAPDFKPEAMRRSSMLWWLLIISKLQRNHRKCCLYCKLSTFPGLGQFSSQRIHPRVLLELENHSGLSLI